MGAGRVAVVTGASSGIGRATAEEFARQGWSVVVLARRKELLDTLVQELRSVGPGSYVSYACDVSNWAQVHEVVGQVQKEFSQVNVLINNAGGFDYQPLEKATQEKIDGMIDVNVRGTVYVTKAFLPLLKEAAGKDGWAKIVNVSSISGLWGFANMSVYTATKFAVAGFGSALERELKGQGIQVATIFPGPVNTRLPKGQRPQKKMVMVPNDIATQIFALSNSPKKRQITHPIFIGLHWLESLSPTTVDKILKKIL